MASIFQSQESLVLEVETEKQELSLECQQLLQSLPKEKGWRTKNLYQYQGSWCHAKEIQAIISSQTHFQAQDTDIIVSSVPRSGTIWLKALVYSIVNRTKILGDPNSKYGKLECDPHQVVPFIEYNVYADEKNPDLSHIPPPRLFGSHMGYSLLLVSIRTGKCRIVYVCRNPLDNFVSFWQMQLKLRPQDLGPLSLEEAFDMYCRGVVPFGPYLDHMLGYWQQSIQEPEKVLFFKYEDMKEDIISNVKRLAKFLGFSFTVEEEEIGLIEEISRMCNFGNMKEFNVTGLKPPGNEKVGYLRKGEVGDWVNHLTPAMADRLSKIIQDEFRGSGLTF